MSVSGSFSSYPHALDPVIAGRRTPISTAHGHSDAAHGHSDTAHGQSAAIETGRKQPGASDSESDCDAIPSQNNANNSAAANTNTRNPASATFVSTKAAVTVPAVAAASASASVTSPAAAATAAAASGTGGGGRDGRAARGGGFASLSRPPLSSLNTSEADEGDDSGDDYGDDSRRSAHRHTLATPLNDNNTSFANIGAFKSSESKLTVSRDDKAAGATTDTATVSNDDAVAVS